MYSNKSIQKLYTRIVTSDIRKRILYHIYMKTAFFEIQDWEDQLKTDYPEATFTDHRLDEENVANYTDSEIISCFVYSDLSKNVLEKMPNLKCIATRSTGYDHIDLNYCNEKGIIVSNVPEYGSNTVAEYTFALIINLTRKIYQSVNQAKQLNFNHDEIRGIDLFGKTLGIVGLGKIGINVARIAKGFQMNIVVYNRSHDEKLASEYGFTYVDFDTLIATSDIISLHLPLTPETKHIINAEAISKMKKGVYLINTARGGLIESEALMNGLTEGIIGGVALDVLEEEQGLTDEAAVLNKHYQKEVDLKTLVLDHMLINHSNVLITPHNAFNSMEALQRIDEVANSNIQKFLAGQPDHVVTS